MQAPAPLWPPVEACLGRSRLASPRPRPSLGRAICRTARNSRPRTRAFVKDFGTPSIAVYDTTDLTRATRVTLLWSLGKHLHCLCSWLRRRLLTEHGGPSRAEDISDVGASSTPRSSRSTSAMDGALVDFLMGG